MNADLEAQLKALDSLEDEDIDLSDIPEVMNFSTASRGRFFKPRKKAISVRMDMDVLDWLKSQPGRYTTRINELCRAQMESPPRQAIPDADADAVVELLLQTRSGCQAIERVLEAFDRSDSSERVVYNYTLLDGRSVVYKGQSSDPTRRATYHAQRGREFNKLLISGAWDSVSPETSKRPAKKKAQ